MRNTNYFNGGLTFEELNNNMNKYNSLITLIGVCVLLVVVIIVLVVVSGKNKEKFRELLIRRIKLENTGKQQSQQCAELNRGTRVTDRAWCTLYKPAPSIKNTDEMKILEKNYLNKNVLNEIDKSKDKIENKKTPVPENDMDGIDELVDYVKKELGEVNQDSPLINKPTNNVPNGSIDPLNTMDIAQNYITDDVIDGNREPFIKNGPVEREEFMTRTDRCNYAWMGNAKTVMYNTDIPQQVDLKMRELIKKSHFN